MSIDQHERLQILQDVSKNWLELQRAIRGLSDTQMVRPGVVGEWSVKDIMAHITAWEQKLIDEIEARESGEEFEEPDVDAFNAEQYRLNADMDLEDVRAEFQETHAELMEILEVTPVLNRDLVKFDTYAHYAEHAEHINQWRRAQSGRQ